MKFNLKNRPKPFIFPDKDEVFIYGEVKDWFEGFQKELRQIHKRELPWTQGMWVDRAMQIFIEEILGEKP